MESLRRVALVLLLAPLGLAAHSAQAASSVAQSKTTTVQTTAQPPAKAVAKPKANVKPAKSANERRTQAKPAQKPAPAATERLDLSLPKEMVKDLKPEVDTSPTAKSVQTPLLPAMFPETPSASDSSFQLNGRLISNEMQLQLRNESRRDLEGAAIEFQFRQ